MIRRNTTPTIKMVVDVNEDLSNWTVTFTMRSGSKKSSTLLMEFNNEDSRMTVSDNIVTVVLSDEDTKNIADYGNVFIQLNFENSGMHWASNIVAVSTAENLMEGDSSDNS